MSEKLDEPMTEQDKEESCLKKYKKPLILIIVTLLIIIIIVIIILIIINNKNEKEKNDSSTTPIYINPSENYTNCIIWLHGLDNKPENFIDLFTKNIILNKINNTKIILLRAPIMKMTYNKEQYTSWFDILTFPLNSSDTYNFEDAKKSSNVVKKYIEQEAKILGDYKKIFIGGHSQGACISLYTGYNFEKLLGGVIACSGFLFQECDIIGDKKSLNVYLGHGDRDIAIPFEFHKETIKRIENYEGVKKYYYEGHEHSIMEKEKKDIEDFLNNLMI